MKSSVLFNLWAFSGALASRSRPLGEKPNLLEVRDETPSTPTKSIRANPVETPTPIQPGMVQNCNTFHKVQSGDICANLAVKYGISLAQFIEWNPAVKADCTALWLNYYVCVAVAEPTTTTTTTTLSSTASPTGTNGITTPLPVQPNMVKDCDLFYKVEPGELCGPIVKKYGLSFSQFFGWNPDVKGCRGLWAGYYVCVSIIGFDNPTPTPTTLQTTTTSTPATTTTTGGDVATPTPTQPGMIKDCKTFYQVASGDNCVTISSKASISLQDFYAWNQGVGAGCENLWLGYYVCIGKQ